jgi:hypothetical protein
MLIKFLLMALAAIAPAEPEVIEVQDHNTPVIDLNAPSRSTAKSDFTIRGVVLDAKTKLPLSEVVLIATSPALQGEMTAVTDQNGEYEIQLPRGMYKIDLQREGYFPSTQLAVMINSDSLIRMRLQLPADSRVSTQLFIEFCRGSPISTSSTDTGHVFRREEMNLVPFSR